MCRVIIITDVVAASRYVCGVLSALRCCRYIITVFLAETHWFLGTHNPGLSAFSDLLFHSPVFNPPKTISISPTAVPEITRSYTLDLYYGPTGGCWFHVVLQTEWIIPTVTIILSKRL